MTTTPPAETGSPHDHRPTGEAAEFWENLYRERGRSWSGNVNSALEREVAGIRPGTALDLGSGEGGDALWLARAGWAVTAVDISPTAMAIAAGEQQPGQAITWVTADLVTWRPPTTYDLVTSSFLHSTVELPRAAILRRAADSVAPGGLFVTVGHAGPPSWAEHDSGAHLHPGLGLPTPDEVLDELFADGPLSRSEWTVVTNAVVIRELTAPDGSVGAIGDSVLTLRRTARG